MTEQDYKNKIVEYEMRMGIGGSDPTKDGYLVLVNILQQQNAYLSEFKIKNKIASDEKSDMMAYKNAKDLWENLPKMIESVSTLKIALKMEGEENKNYERPFSAKDVANGTLS